MLHLYDTRWATYEPDGSVRPMTEAEKAERMSPLPRYWVAEAAANKAWGDRRPRGAYFAWRGIARSSDTRTAIGTTMPAPVPAGGNLDMVLGLRREDVGPFAACFSSFAFDYTVRQKLSNMHLQFTVARQQPMPTVAHLESLGIRFDRAMVSWINVRVDRLNGWIPYAAARSHVRAELDALAFHAFGLRRDQIEYVMSTFGIVERKDRAEFGTYRTKDLILQAFDAMAHAKATDTVYQSPWNEESHDR